MSKSVLKKVFVNIKYKNKQNYFGKLGYFGYLQISKFVV